MSAKFIVALLLVAAVTAGLVYSAVQESARPVVTVAELLAEGQSLSRLRLGARVTEDPINYTSEPERVVSFSVRDIAQKSGAAIPVVYYGALPDTLKENRDVILEGDYDGTRFVAQDLMTQCPSKYEPPVPKSSDTKAPEVDYPTAKFQTPPAHEGPSA